MRCHAGFYSAQIKIRFTPALAAGDTSPHGRATADAATRSIAYIYIYARVPLRGEWKKSSFLKAYRERLLLLLLLPSSQLLKRSLSGYIAEGGCLTTREVAANGGREREVREKSNLVV